MLIMHADYKNAAKCLALISYLNTAMQLLKTPYTKAQALSYPITLSLSMMCCKSVEEYGKNGLQHGLPAAGQDCESAPARSNPYL